MDIFALSRSELDSIRLKIAVETPYASMPRWSGTVELSGILGTEKEVFPVLCWGVGAA